MGFYEEVGKLAIGTRLRALSEIVSKDGALIYQIYETNLQHKWFPVFYVLTHREENSVTSIAECIGHSHVSVSKIIAEMSKAGLITETTDPDDRRRTKIVLSKKGQKIAQKIEEQYEDVNAAISDISSQTNHNLWAALAEWEELLSKKSLYDRVVEKRRQRELKDVRIEPYQKKYKEAFSRLNEEWISKYFKMEKPDWDALDHPESYILKKGGHIFVATVNGEAVGVCALIKREDLKCFELAKMAVSPKMQGRGIGYLLGCAVLEEARKQGQKKLYLESNTILRPAIALYEKLGFQKIEGRETPYERCNIQMEVDLESRD